MKKTLFAVICLIGAWSAQADETTVRQLVEARFSAKVDGVQKAGYGGLYEVYMDGRIHYTDEKMTFLMIGELIDTKTSMNVTEQRFRKLTALNLKELPPPDPNEAILIASGDLRLSANQTCWAA